jgi:hypothetical protein
MTTITADRNSTKPSEPKCQQSRTMSLPRRSQCGAALDQHPTYRDELKPDDSLSPLPTHVR